MGLLLDIVLKQVTIFGSFGISDQNFRWLKHPKNKL